MGQIRSKHAPVSHLFHLVLCRFYRFICPTSQNVARNFVIIIKWIPTHSITTKIHFSWCIAAAPVIAVGLIPRCNIPLYIPALTPIRALSCTCDVCLLLLASGRHVSSRWPGVYPEPLGQGQGGDQLRRQVSGGSMGSFRVRCWDGMGLKDCCMFYYYFIAIHLQHFHESNFKFVSFSGTGRLCMP